MSGNFRAKPVACTNNGALNNIITSIGELSRGELAGERMMVAYEERSQEDEHSCFSDNTVADIIGNARGIQMVYTGDYGLITGPGVMDRVARSFVQGLGTRTWPQSERRNRTPRHLCK